MKTITPEVLKEILREGKEKVLVVDVREVDEVAEAPLLPGGTVNYVNVPLSVLQMLPKDELLVRLEESAKTAGIDLSSTRLIFSCRSGGRSSQAQQIVSQAGRESENLQGGFLGWQEM